MIDSDWVWLIRFFGSHSLDSCCSRPSLKRCTICDVYYSELCGNTKWERNAAKQMTWLKLISMVLVGHFCFPKVKPMFSMPQKSIAQMRNLKKIYNFKVYAVDILNWFTASFSKIIGPLSSLHDQKYRLNSVNYSVNSGNRHFLNTVTAILNCLVDRPYVS